MPKDTLAYAVTPASKLEEIASRLADIRLELFGLGHVEAASVLLAVEECLGREDERKTLRELEAYAVRSEQARRAERQRGYLEELKASDPAEHARLVALLRPEEERPRRRRPKTRFNATHEVLVRLVRAQRAEGVSDQQIASNVLASAVNLLWPKIPRARVTSIEPANVVRADPVAFVNAALRSLGEDPQNATSAARQWKNRRLKAKQGKR